MSLAIIGDIGERSDAHPVCESESNSTLPQPLPLNLQTAVGCARACLDGRARQGVRTPRTPVRKDEQRRMARPAGCARVHSALTHLVGCIVAKIFNVHGHLQRKRAVNCRL